MSKNIEEIKGLYIAHRGLHNRERGIPENSLFAFKEALKSRRDIELDIHLLKDDEVIVFHDDNLKRMTGIDKNIKDCTYNEIKELKLLGTDQRIPLLKEVLELVDGKVLIDIEFKYDNRVGRLEEETVKLLDKYRGRVIVKSFNPFSVKWFKNNKPEYIRGQLASNFRDYQMNCVERFIKKNMLLNVITRPDFIAYDIKAITEKQAKKIKNKGMALFLWNIDKYEQLELAQKLGDSYIYEKIEV